MSKSYQYCQLASDGKKIVGVVFASSLQDAHQKVKESGCTLIFLREESPVMRALTQFHPGMSSRSQMIFFRQIYVLLTSSMTLSDILFFLSKDEKNARAARIYHELHQKICSGKRFSDALRDYPRDFFPAICAVIQAGEESGKMCAATKALTGFLEQRHLVRTALFQALLYPVLLLLLSLLIILVLMTVAVPAIAGQLALSDMALPASTAILIALSHFISTYWPWLIAGKIVGILALRAALYRPAFRLAFDKKLLKLPFAGRIITDGQNGLLLLTLNLLTQFSVPVLDAFVIARSVVTNRAIKKKLELVCDAIHQGKGICQTLAVNRVFDDATLALLKAGERSGQFQTMVQFSSELLSNETTARIGALMKIIEPVMIFAIGLIVLFIFVSIMQPMLSLNNINF